MASMQCGQLRAILFTKKLLCHQLARLILGNSYTTFYNPILEVF
jgi:hypothetical protein